MLRCVIRFNVKNSAQPILAPPTTECRPVVNCESRCNDVASSVDRAGAQWNLQEVGELVQLLHSSHGVHNASLVVYHAVGAHQHVLGNRGPEYLHAQGVGDHLLSFLVQVGVNQRYLIVANHAVAQRREFFLNAADADAFGQRVSDVSEFRVGGVVGHQQALFVAAGHAAHNAGSADRAVDDRNVRAQFGLEHAVEVLRPPH